MAVVIAINELGERSYKSVIQSVISDEQIDKADALNDMVEKKVKTFVKKHKLNEIKKNKFYYYWEFGKLLRDIFDNSGLVDLNEKNLYLQNVRLHMDKQGDVFPKNDEKRRRNIPGQFFKLASYPYDLASKVEWSQWSYLFDNVYLLESTGFDIWFKGILESDKYKFNESFTRLWAESFNLLFNKVDLSDWSEEEFLKPLICTLDIINNIVRAGISIDSRDIRRNVKNTIIVVLKQHRKEFILMQMGKISQEKYIEQISGRILSEIS